MLFSFIVKCYFNKKMTQHLFKHSKLKLISVLFHFFIHFGTVELRNTMNGSQASILIAGVKELFVSRPLFLDNCHKAEALFQSEVADINSTWMFILFIFWLPEFESNDFDFFCYCYGWQLKGAAKPHLSPSSTSFSLFTLPPFPLNYVVCISNP